MRHKTKGAIFRWRESGEYSTCHFFNLEIKNRFGGKRGVQSVENAECGKCGVWKMQGVENAECGKCRVWKMRSVENAECGKCGVWKMRSVENA